MGPRDQAQVVGPGYEQLSLLSHLRGPVVSQSVNLLYTWSDLCPHLYLCDSEGSLH